MNWLDGLTNAMDMNLGKFQVMVRDREAWSCSPWGREELDMGFKRCYSQEVSLRKFLVNVE